MSKRPGDWNCSSCQHLNFSRRDSCQRCGDPRPGGGSGGRSDDKDDYSSFKKGGSSYGYGSGYGSGGGSSGSDYSRSYGGNFGFGGSEVRPGDWYCSASSCGAHNFASRSSCFKCGAFKEDAANDSRGYESVSRGSRGNYGFGSSYNSGGGSGVPHSGFKSGDWICTRSGCNEHNFASRMECFRCQAPRESAI